MGELVGVTLRCGPRGPPWTSQTLVGKVQESRGYLLQLDKGQITLLG